MSTHTTNLSSIKADVGIRSGWTLLRRAASVFGWTIGLAILSPLFPVIGLMHLLAWLEHQEVL